MPSRSPVHDRLICGLGLDDCAACAAFRRQIKDEEAAAGAKIEKAHRDAMRQHMRTRIARKLEALLDADIADVRDTIMRTK